MAAMQRSQKIVGTRDRFNVLFNSISDGIFITDTDSGQFVDVNLSGCEMFGYDKFELIGSDIGALSTRIPPYTLEAAFSWLNKARFAPQLFEWHCKAKDGRFFWGEVGLRRVRLGNRDAGIASIRDITERKRIEGALRQSMEATIDVVATTIGVRDPYTGSHQHKVARLAAAIAAALGLSDAQIEGIKFAGVIHDLGKISIPAEILSKTGLLSPAEHALLREHPAAGYDILKSVAFPWPIAQMVRQHHERIDGSGYPDGLTGDQMLIEAKIIAVADVVEAMTAHRPYRPALGIGPALAEIEGGRGRIYDGAAVDACLKLFRSGEFHFDPPGDGPAIEDPPPVGLHDPDSPRQEASYPQSALLPSHRRAQ